MVVGYGSLDPFRLSRCITGQLHLRHHFVIRKLKELTLLCQLENSSTFHEK